MKKIDPIITLILIGFIIFLFSCNPYILREDSNYFDPTLNPFYHGVASGDPLMDRVIIWTRITPNRNRNVRVKWIVSNDILFKNIIKSGKIVAKEKHDYTVKVDVVGLLPDTRYYYRFNALGVNSITGITKTIPADNIDSLKFVVLTGSNYEHGYYNAYDRVADRQDLDAVIHTGDYIYEYAPGKYGSSTYDPIPGRTVIPAHELITVDDYRLRYSKYRLDENLRRAHQNHPFVVVWDDHEIANDCYVDGAQNHQPEEEGDWDDRKNAAKTAFFEWMPIRSEIVYRTINCGSLAKLILLDERLAGRTKQMKMDNPDLFDCNRTILGAEQYNWFIDNLLRSDETWKLVVSQVNFSHWNVQRTHIKMPKQKDKWTGYPCERDKVLNNLINSQQTNTVFLSGDNHSSMAFEITDGILDGYKNSNYYDYLPLAVEFVTPSMTSANYDYFTTVDSAKAIERMYLNDPKNEYFKYVDLTNHGYLLITVTEAQVRADWYFVDRIDQLSDKEYLAKTLYVRDKSNRISVDN
ncbi:MAG: alkaline phosphatase D family protein [Candidatus Marinimicrobia bacterium]|nr:alkaline phosphatase D family protein [Candidatus Neomarinimicrobiota bacterium]